MTQKLNNTKRNRKQRKLRLIFFKPSIIHYQAKQIIEGMMDAGKRLGVHIYIISDRNVRANNCFVAENFYDFPGGEFDAGGVETTFFSRYYDLERVNNLYDLFISGKPKIEIISSVLGHTAIVDDDKSGINNVIDHLVEVHHVKEFAFYLSRLGGRKTPAWEGRYEAYIKRLKYHGIKTSKSHLIIQKVAGRGLGILDLDPFYQKFKTKEVGVVCQDDRHANLFCSYLESKKHPIGTNFKVTGYGDFKDDKNEYIVPVTTARAATREIGVKAVEYLVEKLTANKLNFGKS